MVSLRIQPSNAGAVVAKSATHKHTPQTHRHTCGKTRVPMPAQNRKVAAAAAITPYVNLPCGGCKGGRTGSPAACEAACAGRLASDGCGRCGQQAAASSPPPRRQSAARGRCETGQPPPAAQCRPQLQAGRKTAVCKCMLQESAWMSGWGGSPAAAGTLAKGGRRRQAPEAGRGPCQPRPSLPATARSLTRVAPAVHRPDADLAVVVDGARRDLVACRGRVGRGVRGGVATSACETAAPRSAAAGGPTQHT